MKVLLKIDVKKLGKKGEIVDVADGYATSALLPSGKAEVASPSAIVQAAKATETKKHDAKKNEQEAYRIAKKLQDQTVTCKGKSDGAKLFGSIGAQEVALELKRQYNEAIEEKSILLEHPIKDLGESRIKINLGYGATTQIAVNVVAL